MNGASPVGRGRSWLMVLGIAGLVAAALFSPSRQRSVQGDDGTFRIVCTFLPNYVYALNVAGGIPGVEVEMMVPADVGCPHDYALSARDRKMVETADVIVANGLGVEGFAETLLERMSDRVVLLSENCDLIARREYGHTAEAPGALSQDSGAETHEHVSDDRGEMEDAHTEPDHELDHAEHDSHGLHDGADDDAVMEGHVHSEECEHGHGHAHDTPWNPHVWVSVKEAMAQVQAMAEALAERDPAHAEAYRANAAAYLERLSALQEEVEALEGRFERKNIVTLHDAFDYLARDLGLNVVATLERLPGVAPAARDLEAIVATIRTERVAAIFTEPAYSTRAAEAVGRETGVPVVELDPFTTASGETVAAGDYERVMRANLAALKDVLGVER